MAEEFTLAPMRRLIKKFGDVKVSEEAGEELRRTIGQYGAKIAKAAVGLTIAEGRATVLARDINVARRQIEGSEADI